MKIKDIFSRLSTVWRGAILPASSLLTAVFLSVAGTVSSAQETFIAYDVPVNTGSNQNGLSSSTIGMDFDVANDIIVTRLGVFDANSDGISEGIILTARLWDRSQNPPVQLTSIDFSSDDSGELIGGSRFKPLDTPLTLAAGFQGSISVDGWADSDSINNSFGDPASVLWSLHDGNGSISFVGASRYGGSPGDFPETADGGPVDRYAAGTFEFKTTPLIVPGKPVVSITGGDKQISLSWAAITQPAAAAKYRVSGADSVSGPFSLLIETTNLTYVETNLVNGTTRSYTVEAVSALGQTSPASDVATASAYLLDPNTFISYFTPASLTGNQSLINGLGLEFDLDNPIIVTRLGIFDSKSDGLHVGDDAPIEARIYDRDTQEQLAYLTFTADDPGVLIEGMRFKNLDQPLRLERGFHGVMEANGFVDQDPVINSGGDPKAILWTLNDANGSIRFVGGGSVATTPLVSQFPDSPDGGPAARYAAGTFEFQSLPAEFAGTPQVTVLTPFEDGVVNLSWQFVNEPLPAIKYQVGRASTIDGQYAQIGETTVNNFRDGTVQNGTQYFYIVTAVPAAGSSADSEPVAATPAALSGGISYIVPAGLTGNQALANYGVGLDFDVAHPIKITKLGVFDDGSDGLTMELTAVLFDRTTHQVLASLDFTPDNQGELVDGSRFLPLDQPLILDEGFKGTIGIWFSNGTSERAFNYGIGAAPDGMDLQTFDGGSIRFVGSGRYGPAGTFPATADGGPVNRYAGGTFAFEPTTIDQPRVVAYTVPAGTAGNQAVKGAAIGMDFNIKNDIILTRLGVFDDGSDGIKQLMTVRLWDRNPTNPAPILLSALEFTPDSPGELVGGTRFKPLAQHIRLARGFQGTISVDYNDSLEKINNSNGDPTKVTWTLNDGNGSIDFVGSGRYGGAGEFPATADGGPSARYAVGTFEYETTPPALPGTPIVTVTRPFENGAVTLNWLAINTPLPAAKYEVFRNTEGGDYTKIGETVDLIYHDATVQNGTTYSYEVRGVTDGGVPGDFSASISATPNPIQGGIAYIVPTGLVGNQAFNTASVGMDFEVVNPITITKLGVFDDGSDGINMELTAVLYDLSSHQILAQQQFDPDNQGDLIGGSRFISLVQPLTLAVGFQGSIVVWYSDGTDEKLFNTYGADPDAVGLETFDGGSIRFIGSGRYGSAGAFPSKADGGPANRYAGATFAFEPATQTSRPTIALSFSGGKIKLTWDGGGDLETSSALGSAWQKVAAAASGIEIPTSGAAAFFRVHQ